MLFLDVFHALSAPFEEFNHSTIGSASIHSGVATDSLSNQFDGSRDLDVVRPVELGHLLSYLVLILRESNVDTTPAVGHLHGVESKGSSLVGADVVSTTHDFAGGESLDITLIDEHFRDGVGEGDHDGERESFGDGHNDNGDSDDEGLDPAHYKVSDSADLVAVFVGSEEGDVVLGLVSVNDSFDHPPEDEYMDDQEGDVGTNLSDILSDDLELLLEGSCLFPGTVEQVFDGSDGGLLSYHDGDHGAFATSAGGSGHDQRRREFVGSKHVLCSILGGILLVLDFGLLPSLHAEIKDFLLAMVRLSCHGSFVH